MNKIIKNRGSLSNPSGRFEQSYTEEFDDGWDLSAEEESFLSWETALFRENAKSIITHNDSPDIGFAKNPKIQAR
jgi:hypothetical protein